MIPRLSAIRAGSSTEVREWGRFKWRSFGTYVRNGPTVSTHLIAPGVTLTGIFKAVVTKPSTTCPTTLGRMDQDIISYFQTVRTQHVSLSICRRRSSKLIFAS